MRKGFTLIELMIVVAIIAVIAAIAIPNLVQSRIASNETSAVASLVVCLSGQATFHKTDYYGANLLQYANTTAGAGCADLFKIGAKKINLIDRGLYNAFLTPATTPKAGYGFVDCTAGQDGAYDPVIEFGIWAYPVSYERGGRNDFVMDVGGGVYQKDPGAQSAGGTTFPDTAAWIAVGG